MSHLSDSLLPSPSWFHSKALDCSPQGHLAYTSRLSIVILDLNETPTIYDVFIAHESKVLTLSFCKSKTVARLASSCENSGVIKIWNLKNKAEETSLVVETKNSTFVEWKYGCEDTVFFAHGRSLFEWGIYNNSPRVMHRQLGPDILVLSSCPCDPNKLAIGHKRGQISIIDVLNHHCIFKSKSHTGDITTVNWSPFSSNHLVGASVSGKIKVWNLENEEGRQEFSHVPHVSRKADMLSRANKCWVSAIFHPSEPNTVVASNYFGDVLMFSGFQDKPETAHFKTECGGHDRIIFSLVSNLVDNNIVISYSLDRHIVFWSLKEKKSVLLIPTLNGCTYSLKFSPHDSVRLGIASRDGNIHIWNTTKSSKSPFKTFNFNIKGLVNTIAWHPEKEGLLAFTSDDGRIGILETLTNKQISYFPRSHSSSVYSLTWAPCPKLSGNESGDKKSPLYLFSCGSSKVFVHDMSNVSKNPTNFDDIIETPKELRKDIHYSEVSFKPDYSLVAIGSNQGGITIYDGSSLKVLAKIEVLQKQIQCLQWHPAQVSLSSKKCLMHQWLACSSNEYDIFVFDLTDITNEPDKEPVTVTQATHRLRGHLDKIPQICWSPHVEGQLVSASYDRTVEVWDVVSEAPIATFAEHHTRVLAVTCSLVDPDVIYSGGDDGFLYQWKISEQIGIDPTKKKRPKSRKLKTRGDSKTVSKISNGDVSVESVPTEEIEDVKEKSPEMEDGSDEEKIAPLKGKRHQYTTAKKLVFFKNTSAVLNATPRPEFIAEVAKLADDVAVGRNLSPEEQCPPFMGFFRDRDTFYKTFETEVDFTKESLDKSTLIYYEVWKGNVKNFLTETADKGQLTELHVSIAAHVSRAFWLEICEKFANQLIGKRNFVKASLYLLMCNKLGDAITLLKNYSHPRDALALAKLRLPEEDPVIDECLELFSRKFTGCGKMEVAANCFIAMNKPLEATQTIMMKPDATSAKLAAHVARAFNLVEEARSYTIQCVHLSLLSNDWVTARDALAVQPDLKGLFVVLAVHESIKKELDAENKGFGLKDMFNNGVLESEVVLWKCHVVDGKPYMQLLYEQLAAEGLFDIENELLETACYEARNWLSNLENSNSLELVIYAIAMNISLFYLLLMLQNKNVNQNIIEHLNGALLYSLNAVELNLMDTITQLLFPFDLVWNSEENKLQAISPITTDSFLPLFNSIVNTISNFPIMQALLSLNAAHPVFREEGLPCMSDINELVNSVSSIDVYFAFFAINMVDRMKIQVTQQGEITICNWFSTEKKLSEESEEANDTDTVNGDSSQDLLEDENSLEKPSSEDKKSSISLVYADVDHTQCMKLTAGFVGTTEICTALLCNNIFAASSFLRSRKGKIQSDLLSIKMKSKNQTSRPKCSTTQKGSKRHSRKAKDVHDKSGMGDIETKVNGSGHSKDEIEKASIDEVKGTDDVQDSVTIENNGAVPEELVDSKDIVDKTCTENPEQQKGDAANKNDENIQTEVILRELTEVIVDEVILEDVEVEEVAKDSEKVDLEKVNGNVIIDEHLEANIENNEAVSVGSSNAENQQIQLVTDEHVEEIDAGLTDEVPLQMGDTEATDIKANEVEMNFRNKVAEMEKDYSHISILCQLLNSMMKNKSYPSPVLTLGAVNNLCDIIKASEIRCPSLNSALLALSYQLEIWAMKFKNL